MASNGKSRLNRFLQRKIGRTLMKDDVVYITSQNSDGFYVSSVKLACLGDELEYQSEVFEAPPPVEGEGPERATEKGMKLAEHSAADSALRAYGAEGNDIERRPKKQRTSSGGCEEHGRSGEPNPKTLLVMFLQKKIGRSPTKGEVFYTTTRDDIDGSCMSVVKLLCVHGAEYSGESRFGEKAEKRAEQSAAEAALQAYAAEVKAMGPLFTPKEPRSLSSFLALNDSPSAWPAPPPAVPDEPQAQVAQQLSPKSRLINGLQAHLGRTLVKGDIVYSTEQVGYDGHVATVSLVCLHGVSWTGEVMRGKNAVKRAEESAAEAALRARDSGSPAAAHYDPYAAPPFSALPLPPPPPPEGKGRGYTGKGRGYESYGANDAYDNYDRRQSKSHTEPRRSKKAEVDFKDLAPKSQVIAYLQKKLGRTLNRVDAMYTTMEVYSGMWVSTVRMCCLNGKEYTGESVKGDQARAEKQAEQNAAQAFLDANAEEVASVAAQPKAPKKKEPAAGSDVSKQELSPKTALQQEIQAKYRRTICKADLIYHTESLGEQYVSSVTMTFASDLTYRGEPQDNAKDAEASAATEALNSQWEWPDEWEVSAPQPCPQPENNYKGQLAHNLQKQLDRTLTKADVLYTIEKDAYAESNQFRATVTLVCLDHVVFEGEWCESAKEAEANAALRALAAPLLAPYPAAPRARIPKGDKSDRGGKGGTRGKYDKGDKSERDFHQTPPLPPPPPPPWEDKRQLALRDEEPSHKRARSGGGHEQLKPHAKLVDFLSRKLSRMLLKGDVEYETTEVVPGQFLSTITLQCTGGFPYVGAPAESKQEAEDSAAAAALEAHADDIAALGPPVSRPSRRPSREEPHEHRELREHREPWEFRDHRENKGGKWCGKSCAKGKGKSNDARHSASYYV